MRLHGYEKRVYQLIKEAGYYGINTNLLRNWTHIVDVPKVVSNLNKKGYNIISHREKDGTATYKLGNEKLVSETRKEEIWGTDSMGKREFLGYRTLKI